MKKLAVGLLLAAVALPAAAQEQTLTVWDFKSAEPLMQPYFDKVRELFNAKHPDVTLKQIAQPGNNYYVLLGTAINANEGPDVALLHNGADALTRAAALSCSSTTKLPTSRPISSAGNPSAARMAPMSPSPSAFRASRSTTTRKSTPPRVSIPRRRPRPGRS